MVVALFTLHICTCSDIFSFSASSSRLGFDCAFPKQIQDADGRLITVKQPNKRKKGGTSNEGDAECSGTDGMGSGAKKIRRPSVGSGSFGERSKAKGGDNRLGAAAVPGGRPQAMEGSPPLRSSHLPSQPDERGSRSRSSSSSCSGSSASHHPEQHLPSLAPYPYILPSLLPPNTAQPHKSFYPPHLGASSTPHVANSPTTFKDMMEYLLVDRGASQHPSRETNGGFGGLVGAPMVPNGAKLQLPGLPVGEGLIPDHINFTHSSTEGGPEMEAGAELQAQMIAHMQRQFALSSSAHHPSPVSATPGFLEWINGMAGTSENGDAGEIFKGLHMGGRNGTASPSLSWMMPSRTGTPFDPSQMPGMSFNHQQPPYNHHHHHHHHHHPQSSQGHAFNAGSTQTHPSEPPSTSLSLIPQNTHQHHSQPNPHRPSPLPPFTSAPALTTGITASSHLHSPYTQTSNARHLPYPRVSPINNVHPPVNRTNALTDPSPPPPSSPSPIHTDPSTCPHPNAAIRRSPHHGSWETTLSDPEDFFYLHPEGNFSEAPIEPIPDDRDQAVDGYIRTYGVASEDGDVPKGDKKLRPQSISVRKDASGATILTIAPSLSFKLPELPAVSWVF